MIYVNILNEDSLHYLGKDSNVKKFVPLAVEGARSALSGLTIYRYENSREKSYQH